MILPQKHVSISESMYGFGAELVGLVKYEIGIEDLWKKYKDSNILYKHNFDMFILALDYLFIIGAINVNDRGCIILATE